MKKLPPEKSSALNDQGLILTCSICRDTWTTMNLQEIEQARFAAAETKCAACVYLDMARKHANARGVSLRRAVKQYLDGMTKRSGRALDHIWKGILP